MIFKWIEKVLLNRNIIVNEIISVSNSKGEVFTVGECFTSKYTCCSPKILSFERNKFGETWAKFTKGKINIEFINKKIA